MKNFKLERDFKRCILLYHLSYEAVRELIRGQFSFCTPSFSALLSLSAAHARVFSVPFCLFEITDHSQSNLDDNGYKLCPVLHPSENTALRN